MAETKPKRTTKTTSTVVAAAPAKAEKKTTAKRATTGATAVKKTATKAATKPAAAKSTTKKAAPAAKTVIMDADFRMRLINDTAYYISEKRCSIATAEDDWMFAELLIDSIAFAVSQK